MAIEKKNYIDSKGFYHNIENLSLNEIYLRGFDAGREYGRMVGYEAGRKEFQRKGYSEGYRDAVEDIQTYIGPKEQK